jgi:aminoglycoside phosphotransferase (APT) family kinase protein
VWISEIRPSLDLKQANAISRFHCQSTVQTLEVLEGGFFASVYLATLEDKRKVVFKIAPANRHLMTYEQDLIHAEVAMLHLFKQLNLPVPNVIAFDATRQFLETPFLLLEFLEGQSFSQIKANLSAQTRSRIEQQTGQILKQIHAIKGTGFGGIAPQAVRHETWREAFLELFGAVLRDAAKRNVALPFDLATLEHQVRSAAVVLDIVTEPRLVMFDLWDGNLLIKPQQASISGMIDLERALWADPLLEYQFKTFAPEAAFLEGYGSNPLLEPSAAMRRSLYNVFLALIMVIECTYRKYASPEPEQWSRAMLIEELERFEVLRHNT